MSFYLDQDLVRGLCDEYSGFLTEDNELLGSLEKTLAEYGSDQELSSQAVEKPCWKPSGASWNATSAPWMISAA